MSDSADPPTAQSPSSGSARFASTNKNARIESILDTWRANVPEELSSWYFPAALTTGLCIASLPKSAGKYPGLPPYLQLVGFTSMFGLSTYAIRSGDAVNGPSMATAWSLTYLVTNTLNGIRSRSLIPLTIASSAMLQVGVYGITAAEEFYWGDRDRARTSGERVPVVGEGGDQTKAAS